MGLFSYSGPKQNGRFRSRAATRAANNLGVIDLTGTLTKSSRRFRSEELERLDAYYERRQYGDLPKWDQYEGANGEYIPIRSRAPRFNYAYSKNLSQRVAAKLVGKSVFPSFKIEESPDDEAFFMAVVRESKLRSRIIEPIRRLVNTGSVFVRFWIEDGAYKLEWWHAKYCYPIFQGNGELELLRIQYVYEDKDDKDAQGNPKKKWFRMDLGTETETLFDNPEFNPHSNEDPEFNVVSEVEHGLGFLQGEWFRTCEMRNTPDGYSIVGDILDFVDELNYSLSQSSQAVSYNQDPQLLISGMTDDEMGELIKSVTKSWNMGREGKAEYLEADLSGVDKAIELRDKVRTGISEISRVVLLDPEKIVGSAQSAKAMEVLHGPLLDLIDELREPVGDSMKKLVLKMGIATLMSQRQGMIIPIEIPRLYVPASFAVELDWPPIFQETMEDLQRKVGVAVQAKNGGVIAPETATRFVSKDFGVESIEDELVKIEEAAKAQAALNPFGGF